MIVNLLFSIYQHSMIVAREQSYWSDTSFTVFNSKMSNILSWGRNLTHQSEAKHISSCENIRSVLRLCSLLPIALRLHSLLYWSNKSSSTNSNLKRLTFTTPIRVSPTIGILASDSGSGWSSMQLIKPIFELEI